MAEENPSPEAEQQQEAEQTDNLEQNAIVTGDNEIPNRASVDDSKEEQQVQTESTEQEQDQEDPLAKFKDVDGNVDTDKLGKSYAELEKQWKRTQSQQPKAPESTDEYEYEFQSINVNEDSMNEFKEKALELGLTTDQYSALMEQYESDVGKMMPDPSQVENQLREEWGNEFEGNIEAANKAISEYADVDITQYPHLANDPTFAKIMAKIGSELGEDSAPDSQNVSSGPAPSRERLGELMDSKAYWDSGHPNHKVVQEEAQKIYQALYD